jgi:hypothetical protein
MLGGTTSATSLYHFSGGQVEIKRADGGATVLVLTGVLTATGP